MQSLQHWEPLKVALTSLFRTHVLRDLRAYVCTSQDCDAGLFEDKESWFQHEMEKHRRHWLCQTCTAKPFHTSQDLRLHMEERHRDRRNEPSFLPSMLAASSRPLAEIPASNCPFCDNWDAELRLEAAEKGSDIPANHAVLQQSSVFKRHVGEHLEQLALFAITPSFERSSDTESDGLNDQVKVEDNTEYKVSFHSSIFSVALAVSVATELLVLVR